MTSSSTNEGASKIKQMEDELSIVKTALEITMEKYVKMLIHYEQESIRWQKLSALKMKPITHETLDLLNNKKANQIPTTKIDEQDGTTRKQSTSDPPACVHEIDQIVIYRDIKQTNSVLTEKSPSGDIVEKSVTNNESNLSTCSSTPTIARMREQEIKVRNILAEMKEAMKHRRQTSASKLS